MLSNPRMFSGVPNQVDKIKNGYITQPSRGATSGQKWNVTPLCSRVPKQADKIKTGYITLAFSGAHKRAKMQCNPCVLGGPQKRGENQHWLNHPCFLGGPILGGRATSAWRSWGSRNKETKSKLATSSLPSRGPKSGRNCYITCVCSRVPKQGDKIRTCYITLAFSGAQDWAELLCDPYVLGGPQTKGQIKPGYITPTYSGAQDWADVLRQPGVLGGPEARGQNQNWLHHRCLHEGPEESELLRNPLHSRGSPNKGTKSKLATSPPPSREPTSGRNC